MHVNEVLKELKRLSNTKDLEHMAWAGTNTESAYGITIPHLRSLAKSIGKEHDIARQLWDSGIHEARILASMIDDPKQVTEAQIESWTADFGSGWRTKARLVPSLLGDWTSLDHGFHSASTSSA